MPVDDSTGFIPRACSSVSSSHPLGEVERVPDRVAMSTDRLFADGRIGYTLNLGEVVR